MTRRTSLPLLLCLATATSPAAAGNASTNTSKEVSLRVTLHDGTVLEGRVRFRKDRLEVRGRRRRRVPYREVSSLRAIDPPTQDELRARYARKRDRIPPDAGAAPWLRLGRWAREQGLEEESRAAYEKALACDPESVEARRGLGKLQDDAGAWVDGLTWLRTRRNRLAPKDHDGLVALARDALRAGYRAQGFAWLCEVMRADIFHKEALRLARPITDAYRQKTPLRWPVRGRWKASPDPTRHHQKKSYAVYALDLNKVDAEGRHYRGEGRRLEDVYAWGQPFYAMAPGRVVEVRDGNPDNPLRGSLKGRAEKHNGVSILHEGGELTWYVHAKRGSIKVKVGDQVEAGQLLGEVGNSGGSAIPHLHVTLVAFNGISVPWTCDDFTLIAADGTPIHVERAWPREGWTIEVPEQAPR